MHRRFQNQDTLKTSDPGGFQIVPISPLSFRHLLSSATRLHMMHWDSSLHQTNGLKDTPPPPKKKLAGRVTFLGGIRLPAVSPSNWGSICILLPFQPKYMINK